MMVGGVLSLFCPNPFYYPEKIGYLNNHPLSPNAIEQFNYYKSMNEKARLIGLAGGSMTIAGALISACGMTGLEAYRESTKQKLKCKNNSQ